MQYNESQYNGDSYNLTNYTQTLVETITPSDAALTFSVGMVRTDSQGTADALSDGVTLAAILDTVTIYQRAHTPFAYNNGRYNDFLYNLRADEDEILLMAGKMLTGDAIILTDELRPFLIEKVLLESFTESDVLSFIVQPIFDEFVFLSEFFRIEITNKALNETLRLADWVTIKQNPQSEEWFD